MRHILLHLPIAAAVILLAGCERSPSDAEPAALVAPNVLACVSGEPGRYPDPLGPLFRAAYGETAPLRRARDDGDCFTYEPVQAIPLAGQTALVSGASGSDCHACAGTLSIHYLAQAGDAYRKTGAWPDISSLSAWGKLPQWQLRDDLTQAPALQVTLTDGNHGYNCTLMELIELTPAGPVVRIPKTPIGYDDSGATDDAHVVTAKIARTRDGGVTLRYSGSASGTLSFSKPDAADDNARLYVAQGTNPIADCRWSGPDGPEQEMD